jgi:hypothetical protein
MTSWRDVIMVHPAAELFPLMGSDELRELGEDIKVSGMKMPITPFHQQRGFSLLDGRNRLDALEAVGFDVPARSSRRAWRGSLDRSSASNISPSLGLTPD